MILRIFIIALTIPFVCTIPAGDLSASMCGDINDDAIVDVSDLVCLVEHMFSAGTPPSDPFMADCDGDGHLDIADLVCFVAAWFYGGGEPLCWQLRHEDMSGPCIADSVSRKGVIEMAQGYEQGYMETVVIGRNLHIFHKGVYYNCCIGYVVDYTIEDNVIVGVESDVGDPCDCICPFDLESIVYNLPTGAYIVILLGGYDFLYGGMPADTIGVDTVYVGEVPSVLWQYSSGCIDYPPARVDEVITYRLDGDTLFMDHSNAFFNCGALFSIEFEQAGDTLRFYELNVSDMYAYCMCYFNLSAAVFGVAPGTYVAEVYQRDYPSDPIMLVDRREIVLGGQ